MTRIPTKERLAHIDMSGWHQQAVEMRAPGKKGDSHTFYFQPQQMFLWTDLAVTDSLDGMGTSINYFGVQSRSQQWWPNGVPCQSVSKYAKSTMASEYADLCEGGLTIYLSVQFVKDCDFTGTLKGISQGKLRDGAVEHQHRKRMPALLVRARDVLVTHADDLEAEGCPSDAKDVRELISEIDERLKQS
jgi:hypothetical protein